MPRVESFGDDEQKNKREGETVVQKMGEGPHNVAKVCFYSQK